MKVTRFTVDITHASPGQLQTIAAELKIMSNSWTKFGPRIWINGHKLQAPSLYEPSRKRQASSGKLQAGLDRAWALGYNGNMKFIFEGKTYEFKNMEEANAELPLGDGAWFGPDEGMPANTHKWEKGNFFD